jgi:hypothetical protein
MYTIPFSLELYNHMRQSNRVESKDVETVTSMFRTSFNL